jgi:hypothetical protein
MPDMISVKIEDTNKEFGNDSQSNISKIRLFDGYRLLKWKPKAEFFGDGIYKP